MANNLFANTPAAAVAKVNVSFATAGITEDNTRIIFRVGNPLKSYEPGREINGITGFETAKGYYIIPKANMDLSAYLIPPIPAGGSARDFSDEFS